MGKVIEGDFYKKRENKIILNVNKIKKILNLDNDVNINCYDKTLNIYFKNQSHFDKYINNKENSLILIPHSPRPKLNEIFNKLKIDGENIILSVIDINEEQMETGGGVAVR